MGVFYITAIKFVASTVGRAKPDRIEGAGWYGGVVVAAPSIRAPLRSALLGMLLPLT